MTLVVAVLLLGANAFFVGAEFALVSARRSRMEELVAKGSRRARQALAGMRDLSMILAGAQLGIALASVGLGVLTEPAVEHALSHQLVSIGLPAGLGHPIAFVVTLLIVAGAHVVLGEMVPKNLALAGPERAALWLGPPILAFTRVARPVLWLVNELANAALRLGGLRVVNEISHSYSAEDLVAMTGLSHAEGMIDSVERDLTQAALHLDQRRVGEVLTPWARAATVSPGVTAEDLERVITRTGFTRYPVADAPTRYYVHAKAVLHVPDDARRQPLSTSLWHPLAQVSADTSLSRVLAQMRRDRSHLALVGDPAQPAGIVSFDDIVSVLRPSGHPAPPAPPVR